MVQFLLAGIPRKYTYEEDDRYNQFVNVDTELEGGESQNVDVITANNDRIDISEENIKQLPSGLQSDSQREGEKHLKVKSGSGPQLPLYNMFSPYDLTSLSYLNTKQTTPRLTGLEATPALPTIPSLLPSMPTLEQLYSSTTPRLPQLQYPVLSPEQLSYFHLLKHGFNPLQQLQGINPANSVSTVTNTRVKTTSVTLTESQEYK